MEASRKQISLGKASKTSAKHKQNSSKPIAICPYFDSAVGKELTCTEGVPIPGTQARTTFASKKQREAFMRQYCQGEYRSCLMLAQVLCRYNVGVECREKDHCEHCGWNPEVGKLRLHNWLDQNKK